ncbi:MAG: sigma-54-dependent Fis family transcriptional regulator [Nitrospirae bacterium]|nr:sigma-54-dependent Fis family transcriptional regulator [Nitrospirota bacterium]
MTGERILIVDDEASILATLGGILEDEGYAVGRAISGQEALRQIRVDHFHAVLLDVWLPDLDGMEVLQRIRAQSPESVVIMISGHGTIDTAVKATKLGAYDFLEKPLSLEKIPLLLTHALEQQRLSEENRALRQWVGRRYEILGTGPAVETLRAQIAAAAPTSGRVLIAGESGTGKELVARAIHAASPRRDRPFIEVNCAAIPNELIESELFGHERGAFTGATAMKRGKFELADGGTLFLDEIGDMSLSTQAKVLRVLEEQTFQRVGGTRTLRVDVRVIAASNKDLQREIREGQFREDLYYRLNVIPITIPPLRDRQEDIPLLTSHFLRELAEEHGRRPKTIASEALEVLCRYEWPGNIRELKNLLERLVILSSGSAITASDLPPAFRTSASGGEVFDPVDLSPDVAPTFRQARAAFERAFIRRQLKAHDWHISRTAQALGIERSNLHRKIKSLGILIPKHGEE